MKKDSHAVYAVPSLCSENYLRMPFFLRVRISWVDSFLVTFLPSSMKVFFCRLGFQTFLVFF